MKNNRVALLVCFLLFSELVFSQNTQIKGQVFGKDSLQTIVFNAVLLNAKDSAIVDGGVFLDNKFSIRGKQKTKYVLMITSLGYKSYYSNIVTNTKTIINLPDISLEISEIQEVIVQSKRPVIKRKNGNLVVDIKNSSIKNAVNLKEVFKKTPGIILDKNDNASVLGKGEATIYINEREIFDKSELKALKPRDISSIEIIRNPGAEYNASTKAVIKIKTKTVTEDFLNASVDNLSSIGDKYSNIFSLDIKNKYKKLSNYLSYSNQFWNSSSYEETTELYHRKNGLFENNGNSNTDSKNKTNSLFLRTEYNINTKSSISSQIIYSNSRNTDSVITKQYLKNNERAINSLNNNENANLSLGLNYKYNIDSNKTFLLIYDYFRYNENGKSSITETTNINNFNNIDIANKGIYDVNSLKYSFNLKFKKMSFLFGQNAWLVDNSNKLISEYSNNLDEISNVSINEKNIGTYLQTSYSFVPKLNIKIGLRHEYTSSSIQSADSVNSNSSKLFPNAIINYEFNDNFISSLTYASRITRPSYMQLNPKKIYYDSLSYITGNPFLEPSIIDNFEFSLNLFELIDFSIGYSYIKNKILRVALPDNENNSIIKYSYINLNKYETLSSNIVFAYDGDWYSNYSDLGVIIPKSKVNFRGKNLLINKPLFVFSMTNEFIIANTSLYVDFSYESSGNYNITYYKQNYSFDVGLYRTFFDDKLLVVLSVTDIFNTNLTSMSERFGNIYLQSEGNEDSRRLEFSITYTFNNFNGLKKNKNSNNKVKNRIIGN